MLWSYVVLGGHRPSEWIYTLTLYGPGTSTTLYRRREAIVHVTYGRSVERPWEGRALWQSAALSGALLAGIERQLSNEAGGPSWYVMPFADTGQQGRPVPTPTKMKTRSRRSAGIWPRRAVAP